MTYLKSLGIQKNDLYKNIHFEFKIGWSFIVKFNASVPFHCDINIYYESYYGSLS